MRDRLRIMTISANLTLPMPHFLPMTALQGYMVSATGLFPSVKLLASSGPEHLRANALVSGFVLECSLKAFITHKRLTEVPPPQLRGHDLEALWFDAAKYGLLIDPAPPQWCVVLNCLHFGNKVANEKKEGKDKIHFQLRYQSEVHGLSFPVTNDMLSGLEAVVEAVKQALKTP